MNGSQEIIDIENRIQTSRQNLVNQEAALNIEQDSRARIGIVQNIELFRLEVQQLEAERQRLLRGESSRLAEAERRVSELASRQAREREGRIEPVPEQPKAVSSEELLKGAKEVSRQTMPHVGGGVSEVVYYQTPSGYVQEIRTGEKIQYRIQTPEREEVAVFTGTIPKEEAAVSKIEAPKALPIISQVKAEKVYKLPEGMIGPSEAIKLRGTYMQPPKPIATMVEYGISGKPTIIKLAPVEMKETFGEVKGITRGSEIFIKEGAGEAALKHEMSHFLYPSSLIKEASIKEKEAITKEGRLALGVKYLDIFGGVKGYKPEQYPSEALAIAGSWLAAGGLKKDIIKIFMPKTAALIKESGIADDLLIEKVEYFPETSKVQLKPSIEMPTFFQRITGEIRQKTGLSIPSPKQIYERLFRAEQEPIEQIEPITFRRAWGDIGEAGVTIIKGLGTLGGEAGKRLGELIKYEVPKSEYYVPQKITITPEYKGQKFEIEKSFQSLAGEGEFIGGAVGYGVGYSLLGLALGGGKYAADIAALTSGIGIVQTPREIRVQKRIEGGMLALVGGIGIATKLIPKALPKKFIRVTETEITIKPKLPKIARATTEATERLIQETPEGKQIIADMFRIKGGGPFVPEVTAKEIIQVGGRTIVEKGYKWFGKDFLVKEVYGGIPYGHLGEYKTALSLLQRAGFEERIAKDYLRYSQPVYLKQELLGLGEQFRLPKDLIVSAAEVRTIPVLLQEGEIKTRMITPTIEYVTAIGKQVGEKSGVEFYRFPSVRVEKAFLTSEMAAYTKLGKLPDVKISDLLIGTKKTGEYKFFGKEIEVYKQLGIEKGIFERIPKITEPAKVYAIIKEPPITITKEASFKIFKISKGKLITPLKAKGTTAITEAILKAVEKTPKAFKTTFEVATPRIIKSIYYGTEYGIPISLKTLAEIKPIKESRFNLKAFEDTFLLPEKTITKPSIIEQVKERELQKEISGLLPKDIEKASQKEIIRLLPREKLIEKEIVKPIEKLLVAPRIREILREKLIEREKLMPYYPRLTFPRIKKKITPPPPPPLLYFDLEAKRKRRLPAKSYELFVIKKGKPETIMGGLSKSIALDLGVRAVTRGVRGRVRPLAATFGVRPSKAPLRTDIETTGEFRRMQELFRRPKKKSKYRGMDVFIQKEIKTPILRGRGRLTFPEELKDIRLARRQAELLLR